MIKETEVGTEVLFRGGSQVMQLDKPFSLKRKVFNLCCTEQIQEDPPPPGGGGPTAVDDALNQPPSFIQEAIFFLHVSHLLLKKR